MKKPKILAIVGSLRKASFNRQLALAAKEMASDRVEFEILEYSDIPYMNQDIEFPAPDSVKRVRDAVKSADGVWFFTPEYNHTIPGVLKNLIDWLSRSVSDTERQVLSKKPAAFSGITPGMAGTANAQDDLVALLSLLNMRIMNYPRLTVPNAREHLDSDGELDFTEIGPFLKKQVSAFIRFMDDNK